MTAVPQEALATADLIVDAIYQGGRKRNAGDDPLPKLMRVDSQGGFRYRGKVKGKLELLVMTTSMNDPDWPDALDRTHLARADQGNKPFEAGPLHATRPRAPKVIVEHRH